MYFNFVLWKRDDDCKENIKLNASNHISDNQEISLYIKKQIMSFPLDMFYVILPEKDSLHRSNTRVVSKTRKEKVRTNWKFIVFLFHASKFSIIFASIKLMQVLVRRQLIELTTQMLKLENSRQDLIHNIKKYNILAQKL